MSKIKTDARREQRRIAEEVGEMDQDALRKFLDEWRDEPQEQDEPSDGSEPTTKLDWDERGQPVIAPINPGLVSSGKLELYLHVTHVCTFDDGTSEPFQSPLWFKSFELRLQTRIAAIKASMEQIDAVDLQHLLLSLCRVQERLDLEAYRRGQCNDSEDQRTN